MIIFCSQNTKNKQHTQKNIVTRCTVIWCARNSDILFFDSDCVSLQEIVVRLQQLRLLLHMQRLHLWYLKNCCLMNDHLMTRDFSLRNKLLAFSLRLVLEVQNLLVVKFFSTISFEHVVFWMMVMMIMMMTFFSCYAVVSLVMLAFVMLSFVPHVELMVSMVLFFWQLHVFVNHVQNN